MKLIILLASFSALTALGSPPPQQEQDQDQQEQEGPCRGHCRPRAYVCHARMVDCYNRPLYTYWGRMPRYQEACHVVMNLCLRDAYMGYGGYGAKCYLLGK